MKTKELILNEETLPIVEQVAEQMPGGFFIYKAAGEEEIIFENSALLSIFGCDTHEEFVKLTGGTFKGLVHPADLDEVEESIIRQIEDSTHEMDYVEYRIIRKDGSVRWVDDYGHKVHTEVYGDLFYVFVMDVTDRQLAKKLEQERQASEAKSNFLFNISHDIRTPMNAIVGFTSLAKLHMNNPEKLANDLEKVEESNRHMMGLIDDLLEMSQIDAGKVRIQAEVCDLKEQIELVLDILKGEAEEKNLTVSSEFDIPEGEVKLDAHRFRRIMTNLVGNAVKFTPAGGSVMVTARAGRFSESGYARYEISVSDTGIGMSEDFMKRMFEAFEREESSTKTGYIGTGLGLSIVKNLLDIMGGSISATSKKGEGSTFTVSLPLKTAGAEEEAAFEAEKAAEGEAADLHKAVGEKRILLVEDIEINRLLAETILEESGFLVEAVVDGCDAVEAVQNKPPRYYDLVLMDIQMPVMNGYEATRAIRAIGREDTDDLPIIALSANARDEDKRMSMESGMNSHMAKPFDAAKLIATINDHIEARGE